ncbi:hypothetical protein DL766_008143 [Monosporascus sp. MC13-8B]|uniref:Peptidase M20 dimerisation domain-containing protein n=1 Tax=Monosporascus cannonballus TaxID=155416 RepID=A0ABY0H4Q8_9PEZI|nr:hypothetical protein DL763_007510 [Monosporascus cannonballus]RYO84772.1 hypothetical protein DL762_005494 [Monosporascus cannonballus]RYP20663.1 hypothetical protein DL766_008143 [Monosporascus sp. MC13-8B]
MLSMMLCLALGHACGHNLIATVAVTGALATAEIMKAEKLPGKVILFGTPAEESLGGKVKMLEAGVFHDHNISISLIAHPGLSDTAYMVTSSTDRLDLEYYGKTAHAAAAPYEGVNAQDALVLAYNAIAMLRQQSKATDLVHGVITEGGQSINCAEAGALATGAELNRTMRPHGYSNMVNNEVLVGFFYKNYEDLNGTLPDRATDSMRTPGGSTDQGNIAWEFPSIQPMFAIYIENGSLPSGGPHTAPFEVPAGTKLSFKKALKVAKAMAGVAVDVLATEGMVDKA